MLFHLFFILDKFLKFKSARAHCDVPCGVYDPMPAQIAAMTVARMTDTILELEEHTNDKHSGLRDMHYHNKCSRMIAEKERSATIVKDEIHIIWGDFYKAPQFQQFPNLHELCHEIMLIASKCKQNVDQQASRDLVSKVNEFAEIFWKIKGISSKKATYHCKPNLEIVVPEL